MDDDEQIKQDNDFEDDEKDAKDMHDDVFLIREGSRAAQNSTASFFPDSILSEQGSSFGARPLVGGQYRIEGGIRNGVVAIHDLLDRAPDAGERNSFFQEG